MSALKAAYANELYKISKKKKITVAAVLCALAVLAAFGITYGLNNFAGLRVTGSSEFSILVLSVLSYTLIPLFVTFVCVDMFSGEFADNTIKFTLTGPASRLKIYGAKLLAAATFLGAMLLLILALSVTASLLLNGPSMRLGKVVLAYLATFLPLLVYTLFVALVSTAAKGPTSSFMLSLLLFLVLAGAGLALPSLKSFLFTALFDWYVLFLGSYINFAKILRVFCILCGYAIMFFGAGFYLFDKKEV